MNFNHGLIQLYQAEKDTEGKTNETDVCRYLYNALNFAEMFVQMFSHYVNTNNITCVAFTIFTVAN